MYITSNPNTDLHQINGRAKVALQGRRMLFALAKKGNHVWGTFLDEPNGPGTYLCTSPSLYHSKSNIKIKNIDYSTVA
jgi:hypothetical protein